MIGGAVVLLGDVAVTAQDANTAPDLEGEFPWRAIGATAVCFAGILLAGLKNSRRSPQKSR